MPQWVSDIGSARGWCKIYATKVDASNNVYVTGIFKDTVDFDPSSNLKTIISKGALDIFVAKYNSSGALVWVDAIGGTDDDQPNGLALDNSGNVSVVGQFKSAIFDTDPGPGVSQFINTGGNDMFLINLDNNGNFLWSTAIGGHGDDIANGIAIDQSGNRYIVGQFQDTVKVGSNALITAGTYGGLCAKYDASGNLKWTFALGQSGDNGLHAITTDGNNNISVAGGFSGQVNFNPLGSGSMQTAAGTSSFIGGYSGASGQLIWVKPITGTVVGNKFSLFTDASNNVYAAGSFTGNVNFGSGVSATATGGQDAFLTRYDAQGTISFGEDFARGSNSGSKTTSESVFVGSDGNIYLTGYFSGSANFDPSGSIILNDHGQQDLFLAKYTSGGFNWWANNIGSGSGCGNVASYAVALDNASNILIAGSFCGTLNFDYVGCANFNVTAQSIFSDSFIAKYVPGSSIAENNVISVLQGTAFCGTGTPPPISGTVPFNGAGPPTYQWQSSTDNKTFTDITGATTQNYTPTAITATTYFRRNATSGFCFLPVVSNVVSFSVQPGVSNNVIKPAGNVQFCNSGTPGTMIGSTPSGGNGTYTYQWQGTTDSTNFIDIAGANTANYDPVAVTWTTYFRRVVTSPGCAALNLSNVIKFSIDQAVAGNTITAPQTTFFCGVGTPGTVSGSLPSGGNGSYNYQWQSSTDGVNFTTVAGGTAKNYDPGRISSGIYLQRIVTSGVCTTPSVSNIINLQVQPAINNNVITAPALADICTGNQPGAITGTAPTGGNGTFSYQWQLSTDDVNFTDISGVTTQNYAPPVLYVVSYYRRMVTSGNCSIPSDTVTIIVQTPIVNNNIALSNTACLITGPVPGGGNGQFTYQWQSSTDGVSFANITNATNKDYVPVLAAATMYYRRIAASGNCFPASTSNTVIVTPIAAVANNNITALATTFCAGSIPATITGSAPTGGLGTYTYQWQSSTDNVTFTDIASATASNYSPAALNTTTYFRRVVSSGYCLTPVNSNVVTIQIQPVLGNNIITASGATSFCVSGNPAIISGNIPTGGDGNYTYQWQSSADSITFNNIVGATAKDYAPPFLSTTTYYRRLVVSGMCTTPNSSNVITIQIQKALANNQITAPAVTIFCVTGDPAPIAGSAVIGGDGVYQYQWQSSIDNTVFSNIAGATSTSFDPPQISTTTYYRRLVTSGACTVPLVSNAVQMMVYGMPVAVTSGNVSICPGTSAALSASGGISYRWSPAAGLSDTTVANPIASPSTTTTYTVSVFNGGCTTTANLTVTVVQPPTANAGPDQKIVKGQNVVLNGSVTGNNVQYYWSPSLYLSDPNSLNPVASPPGDITYTLYAVSVNKCFIVSDDVLVKVYSNVTPPNAFTPNGDGINDLWDIPSLASYPNCELMVFDRYGARIFRSIGYPKPWDGTYNGKALPAGTYYYTLDLKDGSKVLSGWVAIIR